MKHIPTVLLHPTSTGALTAKAFVPLKETAIIMSSINKISHPQSDMFLSINARQSLTLFCLTEIHTYVCNPLKEVFESRC